MVLIAPAFTTIKGGTDVTSAAYTIKGVLDTARTYAKTNNTYTWVGFYEENVANPSYQSSHARRWQTCDVSRGVKERNDAVYGTNQARRSMPTKLIQLGKLTKIDNVHLQRFYSGNGHGDHRRHSSPLDLP